LNIPNRILILISFWLWRNWNR